MDSLTDLREVVDVVIGVDTHVHTHCAAVLDTATGGVLDQVTVEATAEGYAELVEFTNHHATLRAWAIEGTSGHGAGLSRLPAGELGDRHRTGPPEAGRAPQRREVRCARCDPSRAGSDGPAPAGNTPAAEANAKHCQCFCLPAAPRSTPPPMPNCRSSAWSSPHPNPSEPGFAVSSSPRCSTPPRTCGCTPPGTPRRPAPWWHCATAPGAAGRRCRLDILRGRGDVHGRAAHGEEVGRAVPPRGGGGDG